MNAVPFPDRLKTAEAVTVPRLASATPFQWRDPADIPLRPWVYGRWLLRNTITAVVAPGGVGKSSLMASTVLALATGRELLGKTVWGGPKRVWYWNLEDDGDELARQIQAAAYQHVVRAADCLDRLYVDSGLDGAGLCVASEAEDGWIRRPVVEALVEELLARAIDVLIVDPFVSSHAVPENDNGAIDAVAKEWARVAKRADCAIVLVHHSKKMAGQKVTAEASRGASALTNAARIVLALNRMEPDEATRFGVESDEERRRYFNVQDDKHNRAPAENAEWYRMASVDLGNGNGEPGDNIGVVTRWTPPDTFAGVSTDDLHRVQAIVAGGEWRKDHQSQAWVGHAVADALELDGNKPTDRARIRAMLKEWIGNGVLREEVRKDSNRQPRPFIVVGRSVDEHSATPATGVVVQGGAVVHQSAPPHRPINRGGGGGAAARPRGGAILAPGEGEDDEVPGWQ